MATPPAEQLVLAYRTPNSVEARALALELEDADIVVQIVGDFSDGPYPGLAIGGMANKELWIAESMRAKAQPIVAQWRRTHHGESKVAGPQKFQFSVLTALVVLTVVAFVSLGIVSEQSNINTAYAALVQLVIAAAFFAFAWRRVRQRRTLADEDTGLQPVRQDT